MISISVWLGASAALAQPTGESAPPTPSSSSGEDEKVGILQGKLEALEAELAELGATTSILKKLKLSGYVQGRYTYADTSRQGLSATNSPLVTDGFTVRRGRLKAEYTGTLSKYVLQVDATPRGVSLKDAEAHLIEPWTGKKLALVVGQTKWPFGYEVQQSSGDREMPERSRVVRAFAAGERDRGAKLVGSVKPFKIAVGVFDGNGTEDKRFPGADNDKNKDVVGRIGIDLRWLALGVSGWWGRTFDPAALRTFDRNRIGADVQLYLDLLPLGATAIKGEWIAGNSYFSGGNEQYGRPAQGWYALVVQNIGLNDILFARYDYFDPLAGTPDAADPADATRPLSTNGVGTLGVGVAHYWDSALKISAVYELPMTGTAGTATDPKDNLLTLQLQAKF